MNASEVRIGRDRILRVNGKRFFPIAARHMPQGADSAMLRETGFNAIRWPAFSLDIQGVGKPARGSGWAVVFPLRVHPGRPVRRHGRPSERAFGAGSAGPVAPGTPVLRAAQRARHHIR